MSTPESTPAGDKPGAALLRTPPLGLYVHLPWCVRKCPYCDFNSHALRGEIPQDDYVDALLADLETELPSVWGRPVHSVFIGGGTPSLFSPQAIGRLLDGVAARVRLEPGAEVTLEANPGTVECAPLAGYRAAGVNRLSLGIQSFNPRSLKALGRIHDGDEARSAVDNAHSAGFDHLNLDLMYGLPGQTVSDALDDLKQALDLAPDHLSHYQLTLEPNTLFHHRPPADLPDDDRCWEIQCRAEERLAATGFEAYEISAFAQPGAACRHNLNYWRYGDYLGIGAGAHGKVTEPGRDRIERRFKQRHPRRYLEVAATGEAVAGREFPDLAERRFEYALNAFRLVNGAPLDDFPARTGQPLELDQPPWRQALARGWLSIDSGRLRSTREGRRWLNDLQALFLPGAKAATTGPGTNRAAS